MTLDPTKQYGPNAYRAGFIPPLPEGGKRKRVGDQLQPWGDYAYIDPVGRLVTDADDIQGSEVNDDEFYKTDDWWWDHQRLRFMNDKLGFKALLLVVPYTWGLVLIMGGMLSTAWATTAISHQSGLTPLFAALLVAVSMVISLIISILVLPVTTNWIMSEGLGFLLKPFEKTLQKKADAALADGMSEFNRVTGQVKFALGKGRYFEAPFVEFDAYVERVVMRSGVFYRLMFVHRYTGKTFNKTWLSGTEPSEGEILALWDMLQRFMDVDQAIPDMPRFEPFRHLDPVTAEHDRKTNRPPRYWRDLDLDAWKKDEELKRVRAQAQYHWGQRRCQLTPKLGQVDMEVYRKQRPETAVPI
ncbi:hypothetical protein EZI54_23135 [Marinobacter halodurans]|uniref:Uncharacterized protein n=1 Tax=Marinobacter halodurans TaxID=2528979 RepID=A0ABY1ZDG1_9GAMM|nr:hypothetical protein [Marinobacter halodurans]TBW46430.1 hypothetical protein EZI54_23135 [Marinobacter halodurans]